MRKNCKACRHKLLTCSVGYTAKGDTSFGNFSWEKMVHGNTLSILQVYLLMGEEVCTGLSNGAIQHIINNFDSIDNEQKLLDLGIRLYDYCKQILYILQSFK